MRLPFRSFFALAVPVAFTVAVACSDDTYSNECAQFGGACVTSEATCNGTLPYSCAVGVCCTPFLDAGIPVTTPKVDASATGPKVDATVPDATIPVDTGTPDVGSGDDTSTSGDDAPAEATVPDQGTPGDSGSDTGAGDAGTDSGTADGSTKDSAADGSTKDAADKDGAVADGAKSDAAPMCAGYSPPTTVDLCTACVVTDPACQANGCFNGYYCKTIDLTCVAPSTVKCDGGT
jgi:hypothetical protein